MLPSVSVLNVATIETNSAPVYVQIDTSDTSALSSAAGGDDAGSVDTAIVAAIAAVVLLGVVALGILAAPSRFFRLL